MVGPVASYTGHFWSLSVEEQFYLAWPVCLVIFALWRRPRVGYLLLLIPVILCPLVRMSGITVEKHGEFYGRVFGSNSILIYADSLAIGCLGAFWLRRISFQLSSAASSLAFVGTLFIIVTGAVLGLVASLKGSFILAFCLDPVH